MTGARRTCWPALQIASIALLCLMVSGCWERPAGAVPALEELLGAERAFAAASREHGMREAFLEYLGPDSIVFRPGPVDGRRSQQEAPPPPGTLDWYPARAEVSVSGAFGYTTGPWEYSVAGAESAYGHYVSVWRKQPDGAWRVALDIGSTHRRPPDWKQLEHVRNSGADRPAQDSSAAPVRPDLLERDEALTRAWQERGAMEAYREFGADDLTLYRNGSLPVAGAPAFELLAERDGDIEEILASGSGASSAGDLGYTYGTLLVQLSDDIEYRSYARIWRDEGTAGHRLVIDVEIPGADPRTTE